MQTVEFSDEQIGLLQEVVRNELREVEVEMFHTDARDFKEMLKQRKEALNRTLDKLTAAPVAV